MFQKDFFEWALTVLGTAFTLRWIRYDRVRVRHVVALGHVGDELSHVKPMLQDHRFFEEISEQL